MSEDAYFDQLISRLAAQGLQDLAVALSALKKSLDDVRVSQRIIEGEIKEVKARLEVLEGELVDVKRRLSDVNSKLEGISLNIGGLAESSYSRFFLELLREKGYRIINYQRNVMLDSLDADLVVEAERDGKQVVFLVEVKVKPDHGDVGRLIALADLYEARRGVRPVPVLVGVWVGGEVEAYARRRGIMVVRF